MRPTGTTSSVAEIFADAAPVAADLLASRKALAPDPLTLLLALEIVKHGILREVFDGHGPEYAKAFADDLLRLVEEIPARVEMVRIEETADPKNLS